MAFEVSVVIPAYNRASLIPATIDSMLRQTHPPAEVIVVDDGSQDNTEMVVKGYKPPVKYVRIENSGVCTARNVGVAHSSAPWIAFCDSDDLWHPEKLAVQARLFEKAPDVEYGFTNFCLVTGEEWSTGTKFDLAPRGYWDLPRRDIAQDLFALDAPLFESLLHFQPVFVSTLVMKRSFLDRVGHWNEALSRVLSEDLEFHLRCVVHPPIGVATAPVAGIRKHGANVSASPLPTTLGEIEILRYVLAHQPEAMKYEAAIREQIRIRSASAASDAFEAGDLELTRRLMGDVPPEFRSTKLKLKGLIAQLPGWMARLARNLAIATTKNI
jgi:hypothetical protein